MISGCEVLRRLTGEGISCGPRIAQAAERFWAALISAGAGGSASGDSLTPLHGFPTRMPAGMSCGSTWQASQSTVWHESQAQASLAFARHPAHVQAWPSGWGSFESMRSGRSPGASARGFLLFSDRARERTGRLHLNT